MIEHEMAMSGASMFWRDVLHDCHLDRLLPLPYDRHRLTNEHRTGRAAFISFDIDNDLSHNLLTYALSNSVSMEHVSLAVYYLFLFKMTNGEKDLCIGMNTDGRYRDELKSVIGMFVNAIPLRCQLNPHWSLHQLIANVSNMMTNSVKHSYFPLQRILAQHPNIAKPTFLDVSFAYAAYESDKKKDEITIGDTCLHAVRSLVTISEDEIKSKYDFFFVVRYNTTTNHLSCTINGSLDLFNARTIDVIGQRFHSMSKQCLAFSVDEIVRPIYEQTIMLPHERMIVCSTTNTQKTFPPANLVHQEFIYRVMEHPQKVAVELDQQSLTFSELLHNTQVLTSHLLLRHRINPGDVICQCVERSLAMVNTYIYAQHVDNGHVINELFHLGHRYCVNPHGGRCILSFVTKRSSTTLESSCSSNT